MVRVVVLLAIADLVMILRFVVSDLLPSVQVHCLWENVAGTTPKDAATVVEITGTNDPILLDAEEVSWAR